MKRYYRKIIWLLMICVMGAWLILVTNGERSLQALAHKPSKVTMTEYSDKELNIKADSEQKALVLYSPDAEYSRKYKGNLEIVLKHLKIIGTFVELSRTDSVSYQDYDMVILASGSWEDGMQDSMVRLLDYVEEGGKLFLGMMPEEMETQFKSIYRKIGIIDYGGFMEYDQLIFEKELIPGIKGRTFEGEEFSDVGMQVTLEDRAVVYASAAKGSKSIPLIWNYPCQEGSVTVFNGTGITGDFWRGVAAGCINTLSDTVMYPVINALCLFIDDFPSPQYESTSDVVRNEYNRSVKEFYRDIWWPDMQRVAKKYGDIYTGLFIATYNDIVNPEEFTYEEPSMEQYYGNSLLKNGYEIGAHGYNHQSLTLAGGTPDSMEYNPWKNTEDMAAAISELVEIAEKLFPTVTFQTYVPPSNYLSVEGREAVKRALPDLKVISGIYTNEGEEGSVYVQDFSMAEDGIAEFPRVTSGMVPGDFDYFAAWNAAGLYGVFSHFIHPDDIFDEDRGKKQNWESLFESYSTMMEEVHETYPFLRSLSASDAADALKVASDAELHLAVSDDKIKGSVGNFYGEAFFYLKTEKKPEITDKSCTVELIDQKNGECYYIVTVKQPNFSLELMDA